MSSATHVSTLESFYSMHIVLATSCSHLSTACVSCVHWILCTPTGAGLNHAWGFETSTVQRKLNAMLGEYEKTEAAFPWDVVCFWLWSGNWFESWMLMLNGRQLGHDLLLVGNFIDGWCVGLYERFLEEALSLHQKLFGDLQDYTFGSVLASWQLSKNLHQTYCGSQQVHACSSLDGVS